MGFSPAQVDAMSLWQLTACATGYAAAHGGEQEKDAPPSDEAFQSFLETL